MMPRCEFCGKFVQRGKRDNPSKNSFEKHLKESDRKESETGEILCYTKWKRKMEQRKANRDMVWVKKK
jgi:hypothetical protein